LSCGMTTPPGPGHTAPTIALPRVPEPRDPPPFPVLATVAPVFGSVALWALTSSPYALLFALLGPLVAIASVGDGAMAAGRRRRAERARFDRECQRTEDTIAAAHLDEVRALAARAPGPVARLSPSGSDHPTWTGSTTTELPVTIGRGTVSSGVSVRHDTDGAGEPEERARLEALEARARTIPDAPVLVDARWNIGVVGPPALARAAARGVAMQVAAALSPEITTVAARVADAERQWLSLLPHPPGDADGGPRAAGAIRFRTRATPHQDVVVSVGENTRDLPTQTGVVIRVGAHSAIARHPAPAALRPVRPMFVSRLELAGWAGRQRSLAVASGLVQEAGVLPSRVTLGEVLGVAPGIPLTEPGRGPGLFCVLARGPDGPFGLDLAADGPHAIVGGTTGSGKSELLVSWVLAMAATRPPDDVTFLFVDFKGGAAFDPLSTLPHSLGVITDLDSHTVLRALESLRAEVRYRERVLAAAGLRSLADAGASRPLPRLILVVDEYAAMLEEHPQLQPLIADLSARGRSLGIHLILCTQRPSGVVRDGILANCALRISLRVHDRADSLSLLGNEAAAQLAAVPVGRAIVAVLGGATTHVQVATATATDTETVAARWSGHPTPRKPWCEPLPAVVTPADLAEPPELPGSAGPPDQIPFGLVDLPREQRRRVLVFEPNRGSLLVVGAGGAGKTGVLRALAAADRAVPVETVPPSLPAVWDAVHAALEPEADPRLLLLDDLDTILASCPDEYTTALNDVLYRLLREGPHRGITTVVTAQRLTGTLHSLAALCAHTLLLRTTSLQEHVVAGGTADTFEANLPAGAGFWQGDRVQVVATPASFVPPLRAVGVVDVAGAAVPPLVVSTRPRSLAATLRGTGRTVLDAAAPADPAALLVRTGADVPVTVGDPDAWMGRWGALTAAREVHAILFDGCSTSEFRTLTGMRELPPPVGRGDRALWLLRPDGTVARARLLTAQTDGFRSENDIHPLNS
jgi:S-DNA-T family DNA segregation ATPase FtsK/SpoIIIE